MNRLINPINNEIIDIHSDIGKYLLKKYIKKILSLNSGSSSISEYSKQQEEFKKQLGGEEEDEEEDDGRDSSPASSAAEAAVPTSTEIIIKKLSETDDYSDTLNFGPGPPGPGYTIISDPQ